MRRTFSPHSVRYYGIHKFFNDDIDRYRHTLCSSKCCRPCSRLLIKSRFSSSATLFKSFLIGKKDNNFIDSVRVFFETVWSAWKFVVIFARYSLEWMRVLAISKHCNGILLVDSRCFESIRKISCTDKLYKLVE